jgi:hypothetical protein
MILSGLLVALAPNAAVFMDRPRPDRRRHRRLLVDVGRHGHASGARRTGAARPGRAQRRQRPGHHHRRAAGRFLGQYIGWRGAFFLVVPLGVVTFAWQPDPARHAAGPRRASSVFGVLRRPGSPLGMAAVALLFKVTFKNQYQMQVTGNLFVPKNLDRNAKTPAIVVGHPMGAVKEQSANLYATKMAEQGFVTLSLDLSFWGESEGQPRNAVSPDIYAEDFSAAVDFLGTRPFVDRERIGAIGICGSGSFVISAAKIDPRMKAIATVSMYDMGAANRDG